jgi:hypothetical protein
LRIRGDFEVWEGLLGMVGSLGVGSDSFGGGFAAVALWVHCGPLGGDELATWGRRK